MVGYQSLYHMYASMIILSNALEFPLEVLHEISHLPIEHFVNNGLSCKSVSLRFLLID